MVNEYANDSIERAYKSLMADLNGCLLYGLKLEDFDNPEHAKVVAIYFMQFVTKYDDTKYVEPIKVFERGGTIEERKTI